MPTQDILIETIRTDGVVQSRVKIDPAYVAELTEILQTGGKLTKEIKWECPRCGHTNDIESSAQWVMGKNQEECLRCGVIVLVEE